jgi:hypothetical protein
MKRSLFTCFSIFMRNEEYNLTKPKKNKKNSFFEEGKAGHIARTQQRGRRQTLLNKRQAAMEDARGTKTKEEEYESWEDDEEEEKEQEGRFFLARAARRTAASSSGSGAASDMSSRRQDAAGESRRMAGALPASARALKAVAAAAARAAAAAPAPESEPSSGRLDKATRRQLEMELVYLRDPVKLADRVRSLLSSSSSSGGSNSGSGSGYGDMDKAEKAANLVRLASRRYACTVSWNHLINDQMRHGRVNAALKLFNEVSECEPVCLPSFIALLADGRLADGHLVHPFHLLPCPFSLLLSRFPYVSWPGQCCRKRMKRMN